MRVFRAIALTFGLTLWLTGASALADDREAVLNEAVQRQESFWRRIADKEPYAAMGSRGLFKYGLILCEVRQCPERLERLFDLATRMQDRDPKSPTYGNLKWYWRDPGVTDRNAVDFCVQDGLAIWLKHRDWLPEATRRSLEQLLVHAIEGCVRHRVPASYTNIALMNAGNLIVLGETFARPEIVEEGCRRLDAFCRWTWAFGITEYSSPTYFGIDLDGLLFIQSHARQESARQQAAALLDLFWTDLALNWFAPAGRLAGAQSRTYDYLHGLGYVHRHLVSVGWLSDEVGKGGPEVDPLVKCGARQWSPPARLRETSLTQYPRLVRETWGVRPTESCTHMMYPDVTLGCAGACYGQHDMPLTVDLPGGPGTVRCYFIADGREDPYGQNRYETGSAGHRKALHLQPFWAGAQRTGDALGLVVYRPEDLASAVVKNVQSHLVLRRDVDGFWLRGQKIELPRGTAQKPTRLPVTAGDPLVFRLGSAAVGIRLLWARRQDGSPSPAALVDDGTRGALRLTVEHRSDARTIEPAAAFWVRVGSGLKTEAAFEAWRTQFEQARPAACETSATRLHFAVSASDGAVSVTAEAPYGKGGLVQLEPEPTRAVLELDGVDIGRAKLAALEPIRELVKSADPLVPIQVPAEGGVSWEAERGLVFRDMTVADDPQASGSRYVWQPSLDVRHRTLGCVYWPLDVGKAGRYYLWARVSAASREADSFSLGLIGDKEGRLAAWHLHASPEWAWDCFAANKASQPTPIDLPVGRSWIQLRTREAGAKIDELFITSDPKEKPPTGRKRPG
jgi:hypothetical protein